MATRCLPLSLLAAHAVCAARLDRGPAPALAPATGSCSAKGLRMPAAPCGQPQANRPRWRHTAPPQIFAYGQTGTGKTYTMEGGPRNSSDGKRLSAGAARPRHAALRQALRARAGGSGACAPERGERSSRARDMQQWVLTGGCTSPPPALCPPPGAPAPLPLQRPASSRAQSSRSLTPSNPMT